MVRKKIRQFSDVPETSGNFRIICSHFKISEVLVEWKATESLLYLNIHDAGVVQSSFHGDRIVGKEKYVQTETCNNC